MKNLFLLALISLIHFVGYCQWSNGSDIQNTNSGKIILTGQLNSIYSKSNTPLNGEMLGSNGRWGFRTNTDNSFHLDVYNNDNPKVAMTVRQSGQIELRPDKSISPLQGELLGSSGWWGFRTNTDNSFHLDVYNNNNPKVAMTVRQSGQVELRPDKSISPLQGELLGASGWWGFRTNTDNSFNLDIYNNNSPFSALTVTQTGKIGIGTLETGSHRLAVEGSIGAREIKVEANGWSDFVFDNDYDLRTLEEVEQHINENGYLPEVPSEAEVTENGINLGEMDAKLLQKIEELTLYLIEQNKENQEQRKLIEELQKEVSALRNK